MVVSHQAPNALFEFNIQVIHIDWGLLHPIFAQCPIPMKIFVTIRSTCTPFNVTEVPHHICQQRAKFFSP